MSCLVELYILGVGGDAGSGRCEVILDVNW